VEEKNDKSEKKKADFVKPEGARSFQNVKIDGKHLDYEAEADWIILRKDEKPRAEMFYVRYSLVSEDQRPLTFVFNGGPGASSVYLHMGAMGPRRVELSERGEPTSPPSRLTDNEESWLAFTDLVFIDPVGTGLSRIIEDPEAEKKDEDKSEYWKLKRDLESLSEFMRKFLSMFKRWESPVYIAGESYGGFRVGKLVKMLQKDYGVGLTGAVIISPALEFSLLNGSDYDVLPWIDCFPSMAGAAAFHGLSRKIKKDESLEDLRSRAADFALNELLPVLAAGELLPSSRRTRILNIAADYLGFDRQLVNRNNGRISIEFFVKNLLRSKHKLLGLYDASLTVTDPYPDRDNLDGPDPTLHTLERVFAAGINSQLGTAIGLKTERDYNLLSMKVNESWDIDTKQHALETQIGATDDLRYGMSMNPDMKVYITHGTYDLVTPFFSTDRITALMKLSPELKQNLTVRHYPGGHMFYAWEDSRKAFFEEMKIFYK
jgi:carboxypeptidase C (cathepsin A)